MSELSQKYMTSTLDGNRSQDLHLSLRLSVCEGVRAMYHSYQNKKWSKVRTIFSSVINLMYATRCVCIVCLTDRCIQEILIIIWQYTYVIQAPRDGSFEYPKHISFGQEIGKLNF